MDVEPIQSLAFSMHGRPKLYALLLGSGVSTAAGVPTGWEVVLDLVGKLMAMQGEKAPDPHKWYRDNYGSDPDYSALIERIAPTPAERQQILRQHFEPDPADEADEAGASKRPTAAHRAIADLVKRGFVKVIITTNFDRLIEGALREAGVEPVVLSSSDDIAGMMPLDHINCCVLKLHGDYLDERIRNTTDELSEYPDALNDVLDRILQEYGLVVCGWSGEWDVALSKAIRRATARRYTTYWAAYGTLGDEAKRIAQAREARVIEIESADRFFEDLSGLVRSIEDYATPHPLSVKAAVAQCKQFLARDEDRIRLADLVDSIGKEAFDGVAALPRPSEADGVSLTSYFRRCEGVCSRLLATAILSSYWSRDAQINAWRSTVEIFFEEAPTAGTELDIAVSSYPAVLLTYALGIGAVASGTLENFGRVLTFSTGQETDVRTRGMVTRREVDVAEGLSRKMLSIARSKEYMQNLEGVKDHWLPMNDWLCQSIRGYTGELVLSDASYERIFEKTEILLSLSSGARMNEGGALGHWFPLGRFLYRTIHTTVQEIEKSLKDEHDESAFVRYSIVGRSAEEGLLSLKSFCDFVERVRRERGFFVGG